MSGSVQVDAANSTFQWVNCDTGAPVFGATGNLFVPLATGNYAVVVAQNGCAVQSECVFVELVGTNEATNNLDWLLAPNPATDEIFVTVRAKNDFSLEMFDASGRCVAALSVVVPEQRLVKPNREHLIVSVINAAKTLSRRLG